MDIVLAILACLLAVCGIIGAIVPVLPGPLIGFGGLLCAAAMPGTGFGASFLWGAAAVTLVVTLADYLLPGWMAKRFGGSRAGMIGATVGAVAGLFVFPPLGILLGPFAGAVLGELLHDSREAGHALTVGIGSFLAFLVGTGLKLILTVALALVTFAAVFL